MSKEIRCGGFKIGGTQFSYNSNGKEIVVDNPLSGMMNYPFLNSHSGFNNYREKLEMEFVSKEVGEQNTVITWLVPNIKKYFVQDYHYYSFEHYNPTIIGQLSMKVPNDYLSADGENDVNEDVMRYAESQYTVVTYDEDEEIYGLTSAWIRFASIPCQGNNPRTFLDLWTGVFTITFPNTLSRFINEHTEFYYFHNAAQTKPAELSYKKVSGSPDKYYLRFGIADDYSWFYEEYIKPFGCAIFRDMLCTAIDENTFVCYQLSGTTPVMKKMTINSETLEVTIA